MQRLIFSLLILVTLFFGSEYFTPPKTPSKTSHERKEVLVQSVIDGDTIIIATESGDQKVRLIGIDTPEVDPAQGGPECYAKEASEYLRGLLQDSLVLLEVDSSQADSDTYGRLLRFVFRADGTNVNKLLVENGYATEFTYDTPYQYQSEFIAAQRTAQEQKRGLWSACSGYKRY